MERVYVFDSICFLLEFPVAKIASLVSRAKSVKGLVLENMLTGDLLQRPVSVVVYHSIVVVCNEPNYFGAIVMEVNNFQT